MSQTTPSSITIVSLDTLIWHDVKASRCTSWMHAQAAQHFVSLLQVQSQPRTHAGPYHFGSAQPSWRFEVIRAWVRGWYKTDTILEKKLYQQSLTLNFWQHCFFQIVAELLHCNIDRNTISLFFFVFFFVFFFAFWPDSYPGPWLAKFHADASKMGKIKKRTFLLAFASTKVFIFFQQTFFFVHNSPSSPATQKLRYNNNYDVLALIPGPSLSWIL